MNIAGCVAQGRGASSVSRVVGSCKETSAGVAVDVCEDVEVVLREVDLGLDPVSVDRGECSCEREIQ
jgi:hypothetical protein